ncbi:hypothetical protein GSI_04599 [Ganoderma sinense ZZ0214-1]|uniref:Uncharacterized protein n=1 Tax=Ganoderma sinense ZZ0214-1 TaxID=1077348 RepID=A0A2G8SH99_9APHY|nr:hypothetical protein GSI_04599 [Ganoderma sinense ZZ0214-1]
MVKTWCHIKVMKRAGRGNDPGGIPATPPGACVVECPACPRLDVNSSAYQYWKNILLAKSSQVEDTFGDNDKEYPSPCAHSLLNFFSPTDAEDPELDLASFGSLALNSKETGLGPRHHTSDDIFGDRMWHKITTMPTIFLSQIEVAVHERTIHRATFKKVNDSIDSKQAAMWSTLITAWEADPKHAPNPYGVETEPLLLEWCNARARVKRWDEQIQLLLEEMRRVIMFHMRKAEWWEDQPGRTFLEHPQYVEGANAYAYRQAAIRRAMASGCRRSWGFIASYVAPGVDEELSDGDDSLGADHTP